MCLEEVNLLSQVLHSDENAQFQAAKVLPGESKKSLGVWRAVE